MSLWWCVACVWLRSKARLDSALSPFVCGALLDMWIVLPCSVDVTVSGVSIAVELSNGVVVSTLCS
eukprot:352433-Amphidinium_carterae.5